MRERESWDKLPVPQTPQQKINYMAACQGFFIDSLTRDSAFKTSVVEVEGAGVVNRPRFLSMDSVVTLPKDVTFPCAVCGAASHGHSAMMITANPYSRWTVLRCEACAGAS